MKNKNFVNVILYDIKLKNEKKYKKEFERIGKFLLKLFKIKKKLNIIIVKEDFIRNLNKIYRKKDKSTDVLSFPYNEKDFLGEIFYCESISKIKSKKEKIPYRIRRIKVIIHSFLHLLGYDHKNKNDFVIFKNKEDLIFKKFLKQNAKNNSRN